MAKPFLTIIAVSYSGHSIHQLRNFISGLYCQTDPNWKCKIYYDVTDEYGDLYNSLEPLGVDSYYDGSQYRTDDSRIEFISVYPAKGDYGNHNRLEGLNSCDTEWITHTNIDNQYFPVFVDTVRKHLSNEIDCLLYPIVHNYARGFYEVLDPTPCVDGADYMSFVMRTSLAKEIGFNNPTWSGQDGQILQEATAKGCRYGKINAILGVHN